MTRHEHLHLYLDAVRRLPFWPGKHDCGLFVAGWVEAITGVDHAAPYRGKYATDEQLSKLLAAHGFASHVDYIATLFEAIHPCRAQVGDLAVCENDAMGIVGGDRVFVLRPDGLGHLSRLKAERAFRV
jgi:hypothetical protein